MNSDPKGWDKQRKDHAASHSHRFTLVLDLTAGTSKPATPGQPPRNQPADFCEQGLLAGSVSSDWGTCCRQNWGTPLPPIQRPTGLEPMVPLLPDRLRCLSDTLHKRVRAGTVIPAPYTECDWYLPRDHDAWSLAL